MCHVILLLPILGLALFWFLPLPVAGPIYGVLVLVSALFYLVIMRAMNRSIQTGSEGLVQETGLVLEASGRTGQVRVHGEIWRAVAPQALRKGQRVRVVGVDGLTLQVQKWQQASQEAPPDGHCSHRKQKRALFENAKEVNSCR